MSNPLYTQARAQRVLGPARGTGDAVESTSMQHHGGSFMHTFHPPGFCLIALWSLPSDGGAQDDKNTDVTDPKGWCFT